MKDLGVLVPVATPCRPDGELDLAGLSNVCSDMLRSGCHCIFVNGSTGRGPWLGRDDKAKVCSKAAGSTGDNTLLFAGCSASGLSDMLDNSRAMADAGADVAVVTGPGYFDYSQDEVESIFLRFADASPLPVTIYDIPTFAGMRLDGGMIRRLARHGNVIGFKDSSADLDGFKSLIEALEVMPDFYLLQGKEHLLAESLLLGASGLVVSLLHIDPRPFVALYNATRAGDSALAEQVQSSITRVYGVIAGCFERRGETSTLFHFLNCCLRERGVCDNIVLEHEGECPDWLAEQAHIALEICGTAVSEAGTRREVR